MEKKHYIEQLRLIQRRHEGIFLSPNPNYSFSVLNAAWREAKRKSQDGVFWRLTDLGSVLRPSEVD